MQPLTPVDSTSPDPHESGLLEEARRLTGVIRRGWWVIGISILTCLLAAITYLAVTQRVYQAEAQLLVLQRGGRPLNVANTDPSRLMEGTEDLLNRRPDQRIWQAPEPSIARGALADDRSLSARLATRSVPPRDYGCSFVAGRDLTEG